MRFRAPVLAGDRLHLRFRFLAKRTSRTPDRGVVTEALELVNQRGEAVITAEHAALVLCRAATSGTHPAEADDHPHSGT